MYGETQLDVTVISLIECYFLVSTFVNLNGAVKFVWLVVSESYVQNSLEAMQEIL